MNGQFLIDPHHWEPTDQGPEEIRGTTALLRIVVKDQLLTRADNDWEKSVHDTVRLSTYPLALWLATSWWRLLWEPLPAGRKPDTDWRMAHELGAAGHGYLWPPVRIASDGVQVAIRCTPLPGASIEPIHYLTRLDDTIPLSDFTEGIKTFIQTVIDRLGTLGLYSTPLHTLWDEISAESGRPEVAAYRRLEALLGCDPDEAPTGVMETLHTLGGEAGEEALAEVAAACAGPAPADLLARIISGAHSGQGIEGTLVKEVLTFQQRTTHTCSSALPWEQGWELARLMRQELGLAEGPLTTQHLGELLEVTEQSLLGSSPPLKGAPLGLAVRNEESAKIQLLFRYGHRTSRRFEVARWIGDALQAAKQDHWLPASDAHTVRQKRQRAFAAEFLAPIQPLLEFMGGQLNDDERVEEAAEYFDVSSRVIHSQLANHGLVSFQGEWYQPV